MTSAELITELQAARPAAAEPLRERVRAIAATEPVRRPSPFARLSRYSPRRFAMVAVPVMAVALLAVAGVAGLLDSGSQPGGVEAIRSELSAQSPAISGATTSPASEAAPSAKAGAGAADAATPGPTTGRAQRYSAQLTLSVKDVDALSDATQQALRITRDLGGYLVTASYATADSGVSSLTLKVPTANVQQAIVRLSDLGKIVAQQIQIDDLQGQVDELTKRENALRLQIARLSARLASTDISAETRATLEARRDAVRNELAKVRQANAQVAAEARYATIQLTLQTSESSAVVPVPSRFDNAVDRAVEILAIEAMVVLYVLVIVGPIAVLGLLVWLAQRGLRRRQDEHLLSSP
jgi:regulator of replication initiation timing